MSRVYIDANTNGVFNWTDTNGNGAWDTGEGDQWMLTDVETEFTRSTGSRPALTWCDTTTIPSLAGACPPRRSTFPRCCPSNTTQVTTADFGLRKRPLHHHALRGRPVLLRCQ